jgi:SAM-dependent methyltransferase
MYAVIKSIGKKLLSPDFMQRHENGIRSIVYLFYKGSRYECNLCNKGLRTFIPLHTGDRVCPYCGSLPRTRRLWQVLQSGYLKPGYRVLHFSPSRSLAKLLAKTQGIAYTTSDFTGEFPAVQHYDITEIDCTDRQYDLIICYHILEHVVADRKAIKELFRILRPGGVCLIQTPFREGETDEDLTLTDPVQRTIRYGQADHVRLYSVKGLRKRLEECGFQVRLLEFTETHSQLNGFKEHEYILVAGKRP